MSAILSDYKAEHGPICRFVGYDKVYSGRGWACGSVVSSMGGLGGAAGLGTMLQAGR
jgi:hypothetical protein